MRGSQTPRLSHYPKGVRSLGEDASLYSEVAGLSLFEWQDLVLDQTMQVTKDGLWTARDVCLIVSRQNGKGSILTARCIYGLFVLGERILHTAHEYKTTSDAFRRIKEHIESKPALDSQVKRWSSQYGIESIETRNGGKLKFIARTAKSGRGLTADLVILDEAYELKDSHLTALGPTQQTSKNAQTWYTSSAVNQEEHPNGLVLARQRERGLAKADRMSFAEWSANPDCDRSSMGAAAEANPSLGLLIGEQSIIDQRESLSAKAFEVEILSIGDWPKPNEAREPVIGAEVFSAMKNPTPQLIGPIALAISRTFDGKCWVIAAAQRTTESKVHIEIGYCAGATQAAMVMMLVKIVAAWDPIALVIDRKSPANVLEPLLIEEGIEPEMTGAPQKASASQGFLDDALAAGLSHTDQTIFVESVAGAIKRFLPQGDFVWDTSAGASAIPLDAATMARWALVTFGAVKPPPASPSTAADHAPVDRSMSAELDVLTAAF